MFEFEVRLSIQRPVEATLELRPLATGESEWRPRPA